VYKIYKRSKNKRDNQVDKQVEPETNMGKKDSCQNGKKANYRVIEFSPGWPDKNCLTKKKQRNEK
jgi:hypothetical protein